MTAVNHAMTGAAIGLIVGQPLIALPAALASHFICDVLPHFGSNIAPAARLKTNNFRNYLILEFCLCVLIVAALAVLHPQNWLLASACAFLATSPDLLWINKYLKMRRGKHWKRNTYERFAGDMQWFERPIGALVEVAWFVAAAIVILPFVR